MKKLCKWCGIKKNVNKFYSHKKTRDKLYNHCIKCHNTYTKKYCRKNVKRMTFLTKKFKEKNPLKTKAVMAVNNAINRGKMKRLPCVVCKNKKSEAHHDDYSKPLKVIFLCKKHHEIRHHKLGWK